MKSEQNMKSERLAEARAERKPKLSAYCAPGNLRKSLLVEHKISLDDLNYMVELFFEPSTPPAFAIISRADIDAYIAARPCAGPAQIDFTLDYSVVDNTISLGPSTLDPEFSIAFFQAIIQKYNPTSFHFSKAVSHNSPDGNTIVFKVYVTGNTLVYCGDLSGMP